jgi:hypothetical protein
LNSEADSSSAAIQRPRWICDRKALARIPSRRSERRQSWIKRDLRGGNSGRPGSYDECGCEKRKQARFTPRAPLCCEKLAPNYARTRRAAVERVALHVSLDRPIQPAHLPRQFDAPLFLPARSAQQAALSAEPRSAVGACSLKHRPAVPEPVASHKGQRLQVLSMIRSVHGFARILSIMPTARKPSEKLSVRERRA